MDRIRSTLLAIPRAALLWTLVALIVRVALVASTRHYVPQDDAFDYDRHARSIADHGAFANAILVLDPSPTALRAPLFPYLLAGVYKVAPGTITAGRLMCALAGAIAVLLIFLIADRIWDRQVALVACAMAAVFPPLVILSSGLLVESPFIPLELGMVLALLTYSSSGGRLRWAVVAGVLFGLAWLTRSNGFVLALPLVLALYTTARQSGAPWARALRGALVPAAVSLGVAALVVAPWTIRNAVQFDGKFIPVSDASGYGFAGTYSDLAAHDKDAKWEWHPPEYDPALTPIFQRHGVDEADIFADLGTEAKDYIRDHPGSVPAALSYNSARLAVPVLSRRLTDRSYDAMGVRHKLRALTTWSWIAATLLALVGAVVAIRRREVGPLWFWLIPFLLALSFVSISGEPRYRTTIDPYILMLAAYAAVWLVERRRAPLRSPSFERA